MARSACLQNPHWVCAFPLTSASRSQPAPERTEAQQRGVEAFIEIAKVLRHSRCLNCHTTTNFPRQGDDRHALANLVRRGKTAASGGPGKSDWHLAPLSTAWGGLGDGPLCRALKDPRRNGRPDGRALIRHLWEDPLVSFGWDRGAPDARPHSEGGRS